MGLNPHSASCLLCGDNNIASCHSCGGDCIEAILRPVCVERLAQCLGHRRTSIHDGCHQSALAFV